MNGRTFLRLIIKLYNKIVLYYFLERSGMDTVQMNVRIDRALKSTGDGVFSEMGFTPTEAVRRLWEFASRNRANLPAVAELMESLRDPDELRQQRGEYARRRADAEAWVEQFQKPVRDCYADLGIDFDSISPMTLEEQDRLLEEAYDEKYGEWLGLV